MSPLLMIALAGILPVLFAVNVVAVAARLPWWSQPFVVIGTSFDKIGVVLTWGYSLFVRVCIFLASIVHGLWERLLPAIRQTWEDLGRAIWKSLPTWTISFWETVRDGITAAADYVPRSLSLLVVLGALVVLGLLAAYVYARYYGRPSATIIGGAIAAVAAIVAAWCYVNVPADAAAPAAPVPGEEAARPEAVRRRGRGVIDQ